MPYQQGDSRFSEFNSDYNKVNRIDNKTWERRKTYDESYWLVFPKTKHNIKMGNQKPYLSVFLKTNGEQFGEPITPPDIEDYTTITFRCFDEDNTIAVMGAGVLVSADSGEVQYRFTEFDFTRPGTYYGEFEFKKEDGVTFTLPNTQQRLLIIVIK
jgi:hypothetical protein